MDKTVATAQEAVADIRRRSCSANGDAGWRSLGPRLWIDLQVCRCVGRVFRLSRSNDLEAKSYGGQ